MLVKLAAIFFSMILVNNYVLVKFYGICPFLGVSKKLDIEMPGMSGIEFLKQLLPVHPIPVILVSSLNLRVFDALEAGAVDFVRITPSWKALPAP